MTRSKAKLALLGALFAASTAGCATGFGCPDGARMVETRRPDGDVRWCVRSGPRGRPVRHGVWERSYTGGGIELRGEYADGLREGTWVARARPGLGGRRSWECEYRRGERHGSWRKWHPGGELAERGSFHRNQPTGYWETFHEDGNRSTAGTYDEAGRKHGDWTSWYREGGKHEESQWKHGKRHGRWARWDSDGTKKAEEQYQDGLSVRVWGERVDSAAQGGSELACRELVATICERASDVCLALTKRFERSLGRRLSDEAEAQCARFLESEELLTMMIKALRRGN